MANLPAQAPVEEDSASEAETIILEPWGPKQTKIVEPSLKDPSKLVTIILGTGAARKEYIVYKDLACYHSPMLRSAFEGPFAEAQSQTLDLDDFEHPEAFAIARHYITFSMVEGFRSKYCYEAWVLADRLLMPKLQNSIVDAIIRRGLLCKNGGWVWANTMDEDSPLRKLVIAMLVYHWGREDVEESVEGLCGVGKEEYEKAKECLVLRVEPSKFYVEV